MNINHLVLPRLIIRYLQSVILLLSLVLLVISMTACEGNSSGSSETALAPKHPINLSVVLGEDNGQVVLSWIKGVRAKTYSVHYSQKKDSIPDGTIIDNISTTHYTLNNLETETTYYFAVYSTNEGGDSSFSSQVAIFVKKLPFALDSTTFTSGQSIPESISLSRGNLSPQLSWLYPPKNSQSFAIVMEDSKSSSYWTQVVSADTTSIEVGEAENYSGPNPPKGSSETYYIEVYALDAHEDSVALSQDRVSREEFRTKMKTQGVDILESIAINGTLTTSDALPMELTSTTFENGKEFPETMAPSFNVATFVITDNNSSPQLSWGSAPEETLSFVIIMDDEDCDSTCVHWMQTGISASDTNFKEGQAATGNLLGLPMATNQYIGPFPPAGISHSYTIEIFALSKESSDITQIVPRQEFRNDEKEHIVATASLTGTFTTPPMSLTSDTFTNGEAFPDSMAATSSNGFQITSNNSSPQLSWQNVPAGTMSFAIIMDDEIPPCGTGDNACVHWTQVDISSSTTSLLAGGVPGPSSTIRRAPSITNEYVGPFPPASSTHQYTIEIFALDQATFSITSAMSRSAFRTTVGENHILGTATLTGSYTTP